jgi:sugar phosphate isomerase/epimerase
MALVADTWPLAGATLPFSPLTRRGVTAQEAGPEEWAARFREMARAGFTAADLTDSWLRPADLGPQGLADLASAARSAGVWLCSLSAIRRSVTDEVDGLAHLAYSHATLEAAAALDIGVVSFGLHRALTPAQAAGLWFWTAPGHKDADDPAAWNLAVTRFRELGRHAGELGIVLSLEMYEDTFLGTAASAVRLVEEIGLENVGLNPDVGNLIRLHRPVEPWAEILGAVLPYTNYWHVKNYFRDEDPARGSFVTMPASLKAGLVNYREAVAMAIAAGFQGIITLESYGGDSLSVSAEGLDYLRGQLLPEADGYDLGVSKVVQQVRRRRRTT